KEPHLLSFLLDIAPANSAVLHLTNAGVLFTAVDMAKNKTDRVAIFPTPRPILRSLAVSPWRRTPILST
ncbi:hypothetical protein CORC01_04946, partial [Colletotrichum orchidophilum]